jgi:hypothetical protein
VYIEVADGASHVRDADNLKALSVRVVHRAHLAEALGTLGKVSDDGDHVWLNIAELRDEGAASLPDEDAAVWLPLFDGMIGYATKSGWVSTDGTAVRAHIEA